MAYFKTGEVCQLEPYPGDTIRLHGPIMLWGVGYMPAQPYSARQDHDTPVIYVTRGPGGIPRR
ncbi:MAG: hypothetical protein Q8R28_15295 [Dehalococcoidia bacterium]|nr:hypothetical protein [Dehalococcoidia bacterium]